MASSEEALVALLRSDAAVTTHVGSGDPPVAAWRIYPDLLPPTPVLPALVYQRIFGAEVQGLDGLDSLVGSRFQLDCWGTTLEAAKNLAAAAKRAIDRNAAAGMKGFLHGEMNDFERAPREYRVMLDYSLWYDET